MYEYQLKNKIILASNSKDAKRFFYEGIDRGTIVPELVEQYYKVGMYNNNEVYFRTKEYLSPTGAIIAFCLEKNMISDLRDIVKAKRLTRKEYRKEIHNSLLARMDEDITNNSVLSDILFVQEKGNLGIEMEERLLSIKNPGNKIYLDWMNSPDSQCDICGTLRERYSRQDKEWRMVAEYFNQLLGCIKQTAMALSAPICVYGRM